MSTQYSLAEDPIHECGLSAREPLERCRSKHGGIQDRMHDDVRNEDGPGRRRAAGCATKYDTESLCSRLSNLGPDALEKDASRNGGADVREHHPDSQSSHIAVGIPDSHY